MDGTIIAFNIGAGYLIIGICTVFIALLGIIWKGKKEIGDTMDQKLGPFRNMASAITEIQTILRDKFEGINIVRV